MVNVSHHCGTYMTCFDEAAAWRAAFVAVLQHSLHDQCDYEPIRLLFFFPYPKFGKAKIRLWLPVMKSWHEHSFQLRHESHHPKTPDEECHWPAEYECEEASQMIIVSRFGNTKATFASHEASSDSNVQPLNLFTLKTALFIESDQEI